MKAKFTLFLKSGVTKGITQEVTVEELNDISREIHKTLGKNSGGVLILGDELSKAVYVQMDDLSMVEIEEIE